jgi:hypothetical protein
MEKPPDLENPSQGCLMENFKPFQLLFDRIPDLRALQQDRDDSSFVDPYICRSLYCSAVPDIQELMKGSICFVNSHIELPVNCFVPTDGCDQIVEVTDLVDRLFPQPSAQ